MVELISSYGLGTVLIILFVGIAALIGFIEWCKKLWAKREQFKQDNIQKGREIEAAAEHKEDRFLRGEERMAILEESVKKLTEIVEKQNAQIELLIQSDELDIKSWIKTQHEKWIPHNCIDSQTLELLEQRYAIYTKEGGNSWAEKLITELRALPTVSVVTIQDVREESKK